ncbi:MAG: SufD family Fe-S cluster assembly protein [Erysipelotrichaceae bacterium]|nr:SufD family Fe-S cluster assembly protein [Erysipelotrichaceae bacterium]
MARIYKDINEDVLELSLKESETVTVILKKSLEIRYDLKDGDYRILIFNDAGKDIELKETGLVSNATVEINIIELERHDLIQNSTVKVLEGSTLNVNTTYLGTGVKKVDYLLINSEKRSTVSISNNVVCLDGADISLNIVGRIIKGASGSRCFQKTRCLTFESPKQSKVLPVLEIDENDVEASHSLSSGTIDPEVLFYMNSRGLSKKDALKLLLVSYLMPDESFYRDFAEGMEIKKLAEGKVEDICSI